MLPPRGARLYPVRATRPCRARTRSPRTTDSIGKFDRGTPRPPWRPPLRTAASGGVGRRRAASKSTPRAALPPFPSRRGRAADGKTKTVSGNESERQQPPGRRERRGSPPPRDHRGLQGDAKGGQQPATKTQAAAHLPLPRPSPATPTHPRCARRLARRAGAESDRPRAAALLRRRPLPRQNVCRLSRASRTRHAASSASSVARAHAGHAGHAPPPPSVRPRRTTTTMRASLLRSTPTTTREVPPQTSNPPPCAAAAPAASAPSQSPPR